MSRLRLPLVLLVVVTLTAGRLAFAGAPAREQTNVRMVLDVPIASHLPVYVAQHRGFFQAEGLRTELAVLQSGPEAPAVYLAGGAEVTDLGLAEQVTVRRAGRIIKIFWLCRTPSDSNYGAMGSTAPSNSRGGARFAISKYGSVSDFFTRGRSIFAPSPECARRPTPRTSSKVRSRPPGARAGQRWFARSVRGHARRWLSLTRSGRALHRNAGQS